MAKREKLSLWPLTPEEAIKKALAAAPEKMGIAGERRRGKKKVKRKK